MNVRPSVSIIKAGPRSCVPCHNCYAPHFMELFAKAAKENPAWTCYWFCCNMESGNCAGNVIRGKAMSFALRKRLPGRKDLNDQSSVANIKKVLHEYRHTPAGCSWQLQVRRIDGGRNCDAMSVFTMLRRMRGAGRHTSSAVAECSAGSSWLRREMPKAGVYLRQSGGKGEQRCVSLWCSFSSRYSSRRVRSRRSNAR